MEAPRGLTTSNPLVLLTPPSPPAASNPGYNTRHIHPISRQKHQLAVWEDRLSANQLCRLGLHVQIQPGATRIKSHNHTGSV
ncbi:unnamed protein product [Boreogadus saida]